METPGGNSTGSQAHRPTKTAMITFHQHLRSEPRPFQGIVPVLPVFLHTSAGLCEKERQELFERKRGRLFAPRCPLPPQTY